MNLSKPSAALVTGFIVSDSPGISSRTFGRIAAYQTGVLVLVLSVLGFLLRNELRETYLGSLHIDVGDLVEVLGRDFPKDFSPKWCMETAKDTDFRLSVVSSENGEIVCDNKFPLSDLPRILDRPEIESAIQSENHRGLSLRNSRMANNLQRLYASRYFPEQKLVLRVGFSVETLERSLSSFDRKFFASTNTSRA